MNENMNADMKMATAAVEFRELHAFFVTWFTGRDENSETVFRANFDAHFADGFQLVEPSGRLLGLGDLRGGVLGGHGASPDFRIAIRNVIPRPVSADHILATYEEWQIGATNSTPPDNGRAATVCFGGTTTRRTGCCGATSTKPGCHRTSWPPVPTISD